MTRFFNPLSCSDAQATKDLCIGIIGQPNVGKSTLFNRLLGKKRALVYDQPGVTRDWQSYHWTLPTGEQLVLCDTPGITGVSECKDIEGIARRLGWIGCVWVADGTQVPNALDHALANWLRKTLGPILGRSREQKTVTAGCSDLLKRLSGLWLLLNKAEGKEAAQVALAHWSALGLHPTEPISALHGVGIAPFVSSVGHWISCFETAEKSPGNSSQGVALGDCSPQSHDSAAEGEIFFKQPYDSKPPLSLTIMGRPNSGKSTLVNTLLGYERMKTGPEAGITTDSIDSMIVWAGQYIKITDTAGVGQQGRRAFSASRSRQLQARCSVGNVQRVGTMSLAELAAHETHRALCFSHIALILVDASAPPTGQDLSLVHNASAEGRAVIIGLSKWDLVKTPKDVFKNLPQSWDRYPVMPFSCHDAKGLNSMMQGVITSYDQWSQRIATAPLNRWIHDVLMRHPPPLIKGRRIKVRYISQVKAKPPTFTIFGTQVHLLPQTYQRYLLKALEDGFSLTNARLQLTSSENPYG